MAQKLDEPDPVTLSCCSPLDNGVDCYSFMYVSIVIENHSSIVAVAKLPLSRTVSHRCNALIGHI